MYEDDMSLKVNWDKYMHICDSTIRCYEAVTGTRINREYPVDTQLPTWRGRYRNRSVSGSHHTSRQRGTKV